MIRRLSISFLSLALLAVLSGCGSPSTHVNETPTPPPANFIQMATMTPPAPAEETRPVLSDPQNTIWRPGYWSYNGVDFNWVPGEIIARPSSTAVWSPDRWVQHKFGWAFVCGHWY